MGHAMGLKWRRMFWGAHAVREDGVALGLTLSPAAEAHPMM